MKTVVAVYTGRGLSEPLSRMFSEVLSDARLINIIDEALIQDINQAGKVSAAIARRLLRYFENAEAMGADAILNTCSSVGEVAVSARRFIQIPIVRIDEAMAAKAVETFDRIGVIATLPSTLNPTRRLLEDQARMRARSVHVVEGLAKGAYEALVAGDGARHDALIQAAAMDLAAAVDGMVLAQGSMARMESALKEATGKPVFSSIRFGLSDLARHLEEA